jgi:Leucine-rich repeat (LRR) protein
MSGNVPLQVRAETPKFRTFWIPKRLVVTKELINLQTPDQPSDLAAIPMIRFHQADAQTVNQPVRNGHFICTSIERHGGESFGGALIPDDINPIDEWYDYKGQDLTADYQIEMFEVGVPGGREMISGRFSADDRSLWSKTFHVSMTAKQFRELPATVVNVPSGSNDRECVALIQANPEVEELNLENTGITDADMASVRRLHHVRVLCLYGTRITDAGMAQLRTMTGLRTLNLDGTKVTDVGVLGLRQLTQLEKLGLGNTSITDNGGAVVSCFPHLKQLDLWNTRIGNATVARVSELKHLEWLELRGTRVTSEGVQVLTNLVNLRDLRLPTTVTDKGLEVLNRALPNCSVLMQ